MPPSLRRLSAAKASQEAGATSLPTPELRRCEEILQPGKSITLIAETQRLAQEIEHLLFAVLCALSSLREPVDFSTLEDYMSRKISLDKA